MTHLDIGLVLARRPFDPFRLHLADGTTYEVRHPEMVVAAPTTLVVGTPNPEAPGTALRDDLVSVFHVVRLEPLPAQVQGNGAAGQ